LKTKCYLANIEAKRPIRKWAG